MYRLGDVRSIDPEELKREMGNCAVIWASHPYTHYSITRLYAKTPRDLEGTDSNVRVYMRIM